MDNSTAYQNTINSSAFLSRLVKLPVIDSAINVASGIYGRAKNSGGIVGTTLSIAENTAYVTAAQVAPFAQKFIPMATSPLTKLDDFASKGLEKLENNVPEIKKQPQEIVSDTKELINARISPAVNRVNSVSESLLSIKVVQIGMDIFEHCLNTASSVVDHILPPNANEKTAQQNGFHYDSSKSEENKAGRLGFLFHKALYLATSTTRRIIGLAQSRVDTAVSASDSIVNSARKTINNILPNGQQAAAAVQNGETKSTKGPKSKKSQWSLASVQSEEGGKISEPTIKTLITLAQNLFCRRTKSTQLVETLRSNKTFISSNNISQVQDLHLHPPVPYYNNPNSSLLSSAKRGTLKIFTLKLDAFTMIREVMKFHRIRFKLELRIYAYRESNNNSQTKNNHYLPLMSEEESEQKLFIK